MADAGKSKCKYWEKCYRTDAAHKAKFLHPDKTTDSDNESGGDNPGANGSSPKKQAPKKVPKIELRNKVVVFTGILSQGTRKQASARAQKFGCHVGSSITKNTDIVVVGALPGKKLDIADDKGIAVLTEEEWEQLLLQSKPSAVSKTSRKLKQANSDDDDDYEPSPKKKKSPQSKKAAASHDTSDSDEDTKATSTADRVDKKPSLRRLRTHDMSEGSDEESSSKTSLKKKATGIKKSPFPSPSKASPSKASPSKASPGKGDGEKPKCKYWGKCFRKDPQHLKAFLHPPNKGDASDEEDTGEGTIAGSGDAGPVTSVCPKHAMESGDTVDVGSYRVKRVGDHYYCTCMAWKNQGGCPVNKRTCKHLKEHLGEEYEANRCGSTGGASTRTHSPIQTLSSVKNPQLLLAHKWDEVLDPTGWWMSEKLDGVRAYWNGKGFYSRMGNPFYAPGWFIKAYPTDITLDGELFGGRGKFQSTVSIVKTAISPEWKNLTYQVFDTPCKGSLPFEKRMEVIKEYFEENGVKNVVVVEQTKCRGKTHLEEDLKKIIALGGEGVMIRKPNSQYEHKRSHTLLKYKKFYDAEARVIGHEPGKGRNTGKVGALRCEMASGKKFSCGSGLNDQDRSKPPKIGSIITYKFQEYTNDGIPRFPTYLGPRIDLDEPSDADVPKKPTDD